MLRFGIDVGSTTVKVVVLETDGTVLFSKYQRHRADIRTTIISVCELAVEAVEKKYGEDVELSLIVTGSGGLAVSHWLKIPFMFVR